MWMRYLLTGCIVVIAIGLILLKYWDYVVNPWTRDGQVRAEVIQVTPRVSGPIVKLAIKDNQFVKTGDLLFVIDPRTFKASLDQARAQFDRTGDTNLGDQKQVEAAEAQVDVARAEVLQAKSAIKEADSQITKDEAEYRRQEHLVKEKATSVKTLERARANYEVTLEKRTGFLASLAQARANQAQAEADLAQARADLGAAGNENASIREARAALEQAELNLEFTEVRAPRDGYVTNLDIQLGTQAVANQPVLALIDVNSYWIDGYFRETLVGKMAAGDKAVITLMSYPDKPIEGTVESLGWGIAQDDGSTGQDLLPSISPTFEWIRLAQRVPVRIRLGELPEGVLLRVGTTCSVLVKTGSEGSGDAGSMTALPQILQ